MVPVLLLASSVATVIAALSRMAACVAHAGVEAEDAVEVDVTP
jgi:hypothetical protein